MLPTSSGKVVTLKERVAISSKVSQPTLCFGHLFEQGFGIDGVEQALIHTGGRVNIPLQMQNKSMTVLGHVRELQTAVEHDGPQVIRTERAEVMDELSNIPFGWSVNTSGYIVGKHLSDSFQDPTLAFPALQGAQYRTMLVKGDDQKWYILELNEPLRAIIQLDSKFYDLEGVRSTITVVTEGEKQPALMGFRFEGESSDSQPFEAHEDPGEALVISPEDQVQGIEIIGPVQHAPEGQQVGDAHVVVRPARDDEIVVNGITLTAESSLASLRAACSTYGISQSGGKARCFARLLNHQKNLELQTITHAAQDALNSEVRIL